MAATPSSSRWPVALQSRVTAITRGFDGELALLVKDLDGGARYTMNAATPMYLASTVKIAVLVTLYRRAAAGELDLDQSVEIGEADLRDGSALSQTAVVGQRLTLRQLAREMMIHSDNLATDILIAQIGLERLNGWLAERFPELGPLTSMLEVRRQVYAQLDPQLAALSPAQVREVRALRSLGSRARLLGKLAGRPGAWTSRDLQRAWDAYYATGLNSAPMETMGALLEALARGELLSPAHTAEVLGIMRECATGKDRLRRFLPEGAALAHKTGTQQRRACNVGLMTIAERRVVVALCAKEFSSLGAAERAMADVGKAIFETVSAEGAAAPPAPAAPATAEAPPP